MARHIDILIKANLRNRGYAFLTMKQADKYGIKGTVSYTPEDYLFIEAEGETPELDKLVKWCKHNMIKNQNSELIIEQNKYKNLTEFEILI